MAAQNLYQTQRKPAGAVGASGTKAQVALAPMIELPGAEPQVEFRLTRAQKAAKMMELPAGRWLPAREPLEPEREPLESRERRRA